MKRCKRIMAFVAFVLAFAMAFTSVSMPVEAAAATSVKSITVKNLPGSSLTLKKGKTFVLKTNVSAGTLKFSTSNSKIVTVTSGGKLKAVKNGKADITVSLKSNSRIKKTIKVTVGQPVTGVKLSKRTLTLRKGKSAVLRATVQTSKASNKKLIWKSSNAKAVKVTQTGKVVALKGGSAVVTATAADGSGKKASCRVTVKAPVTSVKFSKSSGKVYIGSTYDLKAVVQPADATNKKCIWSSSNEKVAMVSSAGRIVGITEGSAVITAKAADGSGKKATFKVTVAKPVTIDTVTLSDPRTIKLKLSGSQKLGASSFEVRKETVINGEYKTNVPIASVTTKDNKNYVIKLKRGNELNSRTRIRVLVSGLNGTGRSQKETYYSGGKTYKTFYESYSCEQNFEMENILYLGCDGVGTITVTGLPEGVTYQRMKDRVNGIRFKGKPTKAGMTTTTIKAVDELGNVENYIITWSIFNSSVILTDYLDQYIVLDETPSYNYMINRVPVPVTGGSGKYTFELIDGMKNWKINDQGKISGLIHDPGTYVIKVKITDANNSKLSTIVDYKIEAVLGIKVSGTVKDIKGNALKGATLTFINKDNNCKYNDGTIKYPTVWDDGGKYIARLVPGTYDVQIRVGDDITYAGTKTFTGNTTDVNFVSDVMKIAVNSDNGEYSVDDIGNWIDEYGRKCGSDGYIYVVPGTYKLTAISEDKSKRGTITANVTDKTVSVTAKVENYIGDFGDATSVFAEKDRYYRFVPKTSGTYYFYSISSANPHGYLYDENMKLLVDQAYKKHALTNNGSDFCMSYECEAGKTYYLMCEGNSSRVYATKTDPNK